MTIRSALTESLRPDVWVGFGHACPARWQRSADLSRICNGRACPEGCGLDASGRNMSGRAATMGRAIREGSIMCLNCGCGTPEDRHGDDANITVGDLRDAAQANGQSLDETVRNVRSSLDQVEQGQAAGA